MDSGPGEMWDTDLTAVLDTVGFERPALVGEGQASEQAIHFSATHPERVSALVLVNGFAHYVREDDYPWGGLGGSRRRRSAVAQISSERDLIDLCQRLRRGLERARDQLEQSPDANISPRLSDALDDVIDEAQDCRKYGLD